MARKKIKKINEFSGNNATGEVSTDIISDFNPMSELGTTGRSKFSDINYEEHIRELRGRNAALVYRRMANDEAMIASILYAIKMLIKQVDWSASPYGSTARHKKDASFLQSNMDGMSHSFKDMISEILSFLTYGWSLTEICYKYSKEGKIVWRKIPIRPQTTLDRWIYDDKGGLKAFRQLTINGTFPIEIPIEKTLLFRTELNGNSPEGKSILRPAYRAWRRKSDIEDIEGIGLERGLAGIPIITAPHQIMSKNAQPGEKALFEQFKKIVSGVKVNEMTGVVFPASEYGTGQNITKTGYKFDLLAPTSKSQFNTNEIINRYKQEIAMVMLGDFLLLGHGAAGSYSLSSDKTGLFTMSVKAILDIICDVFNKYAIPRLFALNGNISQELPKLTYSDIEKVELKDIGFFIQSLTLAGLITPDLDTENFFRKIGNIPQKSLKDGEEYNPPTPPKKDNKALPNQNDGVKSNGTDSSS